jgi:hypothetical protein
MALRFVRTMDKSPHMFSSTDEADNDWLLYCGGWQVGRVYRPGGLKQGTFAWSLTGPHTPEARVSMRGEAATLEEGRQQLVGAMRDWAVWAGVRQAVGAAEPRWVLTKDHLPDHPMTTTTGDPTTDWLLISGNFVAGRVHRPAQGHDPHWRLLGTSSTECPTPQAGWADTIDGAKAALLDAWQAWLEWAELRRSPPAAS